MTRSHCECSDGVEHRGTAFPAEKARLGSIDAGERGAELERTVRLCVSTARFYAETETSRGREAAEALGRRLLARLIPIFLEHVSPGATSETRTGDEFAVTFLLQISTAISLLDREFSVFGATERKALETRISAWTESQSQA